jgi:3',5'-cyclic AMP phosphodiesterase CpdA
MRHLLRQLNIVHVSDIHFGRNHVCAPEENGEAAAGIPDLGSSIRADVAQLLAARPELGQPPAVPLLIAATGDLTETAATVDPTEFDRAETFLRHLCEAERSQDELRRMFLVPGNHDVVFNERGSIERRWQPYCSFYTKLFEGVRPGITDRKARSLTQLHDRVADGFVIAEINSALYVARDSPDAARGQVDREAIAMLQAQLDELRKRDSAAFENSIRIAIMHHHPVLLPSLVEPGRGYDAILNAHSLLRLVQDFGFHVILHGHKHYPQTFSYDPDYAWSTKPASPPLLVVSGGSAGSTGLPVGTRATNSYNLITVKWHPAARQARVQVLTRGLVRLGDDGPLPPHLWRWVDYARSDRLLRPLDGIPSPKGGERLETIDPGADGARMQVYGTTRGNMAVVEVLPSLMNGQAYEARVWIVPHKRKQVDVPVEVTWNAGRHFSRKRVTRDADPKFCTTFSYWDSMLVEAQMTFADGTTASAFAYARVPDGQ